MRVRLAAAALTLATLASIVFSADGIRFEPAARANLFAAARVDDAPLARTHRPLIGVLSQPPYWEGAPAAPRGYIAASYVKWLETAGARAVPIWYDEPNATLDAKLAAVNGVLLPGGDSDVSRGTPLRATAERIVRAALDARDAGDYFPVWGTCMGFQLLALVVADDPLDAPLEPYDGANVASHLRVVERADRGRALGSLHEDVYAAATGTSMGCRPVGCPPRRCTRITSSASRRERLRISRDWRRRSVRRSRRTRIAEGERSRRSWRDARVCRCTARSSTRRNPRRSGTRRSRFRTRRKPSPSDRVWPTFSSPRRGDRVDRQSRTPSRGSRRTIW